MEPKRLPLLTSTDWNAEWKHLQKQRKHADDSRVWDKKAKTFPVKHGSQDGYAGRFIDLAGIQPNETVFDMGCGTGLLAMPLAQAGHNIVACDFSQGMLEAMKRDQEALGIDCVDPHLLSWADDWKAHGFSRDMCDVALASRSIATYDLEDALRKLDWVARRRACITLPSLSSPRLDVRLAQAAGLDREVGRDFLYAFNIVAQWGVVPEVSLIASTRRELFASRQDACDAYVRIVLDSLASADNAPTASEVEGRISPWLDSELIEVEEGFKLKRDREVAWAFIAWSSTKTEWF